MSADLKPNFEPENIVKNISKAINIGMTHSALASNGVDWESVVGVLDEAEHLIGKEMSVNSHLNSVRFTDEFNTQYEKTLPLISLNRSDLAPSRATPESSKLRNESFTICCCWIFNSV